MKIEVGKKYLDEIGDSWTVIGPCQYIHQLFKVVKDSHPSMGPERFTKFGMAASLGIPNLVSEVPSPATTTPQFKVGDRVRVVSEICHPGGVGTVQQITDTKGVKGVKVWLDTVDDFCWYSEKSLEHLHPTTTTPSLVQCSCPTVVLMRDGCRCGNARKEIEQEFKQRGWG